MIVGLSGYARSGKDTVAELHVLNYGFKRMAYLTMGLNAWRLLMVFVKHYLH